MNGTPKYQFGMRLTEEVYVRYNHAISWQNPKVKINMFLSAGLTAVVGTWALHYCGFFNLIPFYFIYIVPVLLFIFGLWFFRHNIDKSASNAFRANNMEVEWDFRFFDDHFEVAAKAGTSSHKYADLTDIVINDQDIYIMYGAMMGYCIPRESCPLGFPDFLESKKLLLRK